MLNLTNLIGFGARAAGENIVTDGLALHLDAGNADSYPGSGQTFFDLTTNNYDWYLGAGSGSGTDDPTFNGTAGGKSGSEYFSFDGGDFFSKVNADAGSIIRTLGRQNQAFTLEFWVYVSAYATDRGLFDNGHNNSNSALLTWPETAGTGARWYVSGAVRATFTAVATGAWYQFAVTGQMDNTTSYKVINGASDGSFTYNATSWTSGDSANTGRIGNLSNFSGFIPNGSRVAICRMYNRALSLAELTQNFDAQRNRYGI